MQKIGYKRNTMLGQAIGCLILAAGGAWVAFLNAPVFLRIFAGVMALGLPVGAFGLIRRYLSEDDALSFDSTFLEINTLYTSARFRWERVQDIRRTVLQQKSLFGLIKQDIAHYIEVDGIDVDHEHRTVRLHEDLLDLPKQGREKLFHDLVTQWHTPPHLRETSRPNAVGRPSAPAAAAPPRPSFGRKTV